MRGVRRAAVIVLLAVLGGCAEREAAAPPPALGAFTLPGMSASERALDAEAVAADAPDGAALRAALEDTGFRAGTERTYTGGGGRAFTRVVVRSLGFGDAAAADGFLAWLGEHASAAVPAAAPAALGVPTGVVVIAHEPDGCCPREAPIYLAAWRRGAEVLTVRASGREATDDAMERLVRALEEEL
jgi:hypothetical protein